MSEISGGEEAVLCDTTDFNSLAQRLSIQVAGVSKKYLGEFMIKAERNALLQDVGLNYNFKPLKGTTRV